LKKLIFSLLLVIGALQGFGGGTDAIFSSAFANHQNNIQVQGGGEIIKILPDDHDGSRHQRFIIKRTSGQTLLIAHNIDLATRVADIQIGDTVEFYGEYEWNPQGGVVHWTHRDPQGQHPAGWIKHKGQIYP
jgi:hypothetical protein